MMRSSAMLGIRVSRGCAYHGLALNVDMDLAPFAAKDFARAIAGME